MSDLSDHTPQNSAPRIMCGCGANHAAQEHTSDHDLSTEQGISDNLLETAMLNALFPHAPTRRAFLSSIGKNAAMAAIASIVPLSSMQAMAQEAGPLEKVNLKVGFIAITCAAPLIMAEPLGYYREQGLKVQLVKTAGWGMIRDKILKTNMMPRISCRRCHWQCL